jgi:hypothetical protein
MQTTQSKFNRTIKIIGSDGAALVIEASFFSLDYEVYKVDDYGDRVYTVERRNRYVELLPAKILEECLTSALYTPVFKVEPECPPEEESIKDVVGFISKVWLSNSGIASVRAHITDRLFAEELKHGPDKIICAQYLVSLQKLATEGRSCVYEQTHRMTTSFAFDDAP